MGKGGSAGGRTTRLMSGAGGIAGGHPVGVEATRSPGR